MPRMINDPVPKNKAPSTQQLASLLTSGKSGQGRCCSMLLHTLLTFRAPLGSLASVLGARWVVSSLQRSRVVSRWLLFVLASCGTAWAGMAAPRIRGCKKQICLTLVTEFCARGYQCYSLCSFLSGIPDSAVTHGAPPLPLLVSVSLSTILSEGRACFLLAWAVLVPNLMPGCRF